jgi:catechol 2,3-dioxygenase-like lactoylglutathione lyase family enzyme
LGKASEKLQLTGVNHVIYPVRDVARSLRFYRDVLGIEQVPVMQPNVDPERMVWLRLPSRTMLHLIRGDTVPAPDPIHIAFEVAEFDVVLRAVEEHGLKVLNTGTRGDGQRYLFFRDPDGNRVELCTPSGF